MNLVMTLLVRNEEDILDWNLRFHYEQGISFVIATDNKSTDSTPDILKKYEAEGRLLYIREDGDDYSQDLWVTRMARMAAIQYKADWVINNDADEFWYPVQGSLAGLLEQQPSDVSTICCRRHNFLPINDEDPSAPFWQHMLYRQIKSTNAMGLDLPGKVCHRASPTVYVGQGNHSAEGLCGIQRTLDNIEILHFPMRSYEQFSKKILLGGAAYARNQRLPLTAGRAWRKLYALHLECGLREWYDDQVLRLDSSFSPLDCDNSVMLDKRLFSYFTSAENVKPQS